MSEPLPPTREALRVAIQAREAAEAASKRVAATFYQATLEVIDAENAIKAFDAVDKRIADHRAEMVRRWAENGGDRPDMSVPPALAAERAGRADAEAYLESLRAVVAKIEADATAARVAAEAATQAVTHAAEAVVREESAVAHAELQRLEDAAYELRCKFGALSALRTGSWESPVDPQMRQTLGAPLRNPQNRGLSFVPGTDPLPKQWRAYLKALETDPAAQFGALAA